MRRRVSERKSKPKVNYSAGLSPAKLIKTTGPGKQKVRPKLRTKAKLVPLWPYLKHTFIFSSRSAALVWWIVWRVFSFRVQRNQSNYCMPTVSLVFFCFLFLKTRQIQYCQITSFAYCSLLPRSSSTKAENDCWQQWLQCVVSQPCLSAALSSKIKYYGPPWLNYIRPQWSICSIKLPTCLVNDRICLMWQMCVRWCPKLHEKRGVLSGSRVAYIQP